MYPIGVGIIGAGVISNLHLRAYSQIPEAKVVALCDLNENLVKKKAKTWGIDKTYTDYINLLNDSKIEAIEILTPQKLHKEMSVAALKAGKHVSVQKPMAVTMAEVKEMVSAAKNFSKIARVYENFRFYPAIRKAKELVDNGEIGEPLSIRFKLTNGIGGKGDFAHKKSETWNRRMDVAESGGGAVTFDHGYHIYSLAKYFISEIESVFAWIGKKKDQSGYIWDSPAMISWRYKGKNRFGVWEQVWGDELFIKTNYYAGEDRMEITGSRGIIWVTKCTAEFLDVPSLILYRDGKLTSFHNLETDWQASFTACTQNFIDSILDKAEPELSFAEGCDVQKITIAVKQSHDQGRLVSVAEVK